jgi:hypothetical protein
MAFTFVPTTLAEAIEELRTQVDGRSSPPPTAATTPFAPGSTSRSTSAGSRHRRAGEHQQAWPSRARPLLRLRRHPGDRSRHRPSTHDASSSSPPASTASRRPRGPHGVRPSRRQVGEGARAGTGTDWRPSSDRRATRRRLHPRRRQWLLARHYGLSSDAVHPSTSSRPTASGHASADEQSELFWALKGGGGGARVIRRHGDRPLLDRVCGNLLYRHRWRTRSPGAESDWVSGVPKARVLGRRDPLPPLDTVPEPLRGSRSRSCAAAGRGRPSPVRLSTEWRNWRAPLVVFDPMPLRRTTPSAGTPGSRAGHGLTRVRHASRQAITVVKATLPAPGQPPTLLSRESRHAGGAIGFGLRARQHHGLLEAVPIR